MTAHDLDTILGWRGRTVVDRDGDKLGKLGALYLDDGDRPAYAGVHTGLFGLKESIVPLDGLREEGDVLVLPLAADVVRDAPSVDPDEGTLTPEDEERLGGHYAGHVEMTRSEEEVEVGKTEMRPTHRVRLRKVRVTENVKTTVPVQREEIRLENDPPREGRIERVEDVDD